MYPTLHQKVSKSRVRSNQNTEIANIRVHNRVMTGREMTYEAEEVDGYEKEQSARDTDP